MKNKTNLKNNMKFKLLILAASTISSQLSQNISVKTVQNLVQNLTYPIKKSDTKSSYSAGLGSEDDEIHFNSIFEGFVDSEDRNFEHLFSKEAEFDQKYRFDVIHELDEELIPLNRNIEVITTTSTVATTTGDSSDPGFDSTCVDGNLVIEIPYPNSYTGNLLGKGEKMVKNCDKNGKNCEKW